MRASINTRSPGLPCEEVTPQVLPVPNNTAQTTPIALNNNDPSVRCNDNTPQIPNPYTRPVDPYAMVPPLTPGQVVWQMLRQPQVVIHPPLSPPTLSCLPEAQLPQNTIDSPIIQPPLGLLQQARTK